MGLREEMGLARDLFGSPRSTAAVAATATAVGYSVDGQVEIQYDGDEETMVVDCVGAIAIGDEVDVIIRDGGSTFVVGSKGSGDAQAAAIESHGEAIEEASHAIDALNGNVTQLESRFEGVEVDVTTLQEALNGYGVWIRETDAGLFLGKDTSPFSVLLDNDELGFYQGDEKVAYLSNEQLYISEALVRGKMQMGSFVWTPRPDGSMFLAWAG